MKKSVTIIPCLKDNYSYLLHAKDTVIVIDPAEDQKIADLLDETSLHLNYLLCTHHHTDHMAGAFGLKKKTHCKLWGPDERIPELDRTVRDGEKLKMGPFSFEVVSTPGHTDKSVCYYWKKGKTLFTGDVLFGGGCGRLFEGIPEEMYGSLKKIANFPDDTEIYCGHEYTLKNLKFALTIRKTRNFKSATNKRKD